MFAEVVGRACRLPGADGVDEFWNLLIGNRCSVTRVPSERFSQSWYFHPRKGTPGKAYTFAAGVLDDIWGFDPAVFAITPREARQMDPQQRLVLQLAWEALEDAGIVASELSGKSVGVYMGASSMDHSHRQYFDPAGTDSYLMTGNTLSLIANRVSYSLDLKGPSLTFDTACSSSLVALDYAIQDLRTGRVDAAIVGGVNALLSPFNFMGFCAASMLSPDGLCRPFDHRANGYVRSEGGVALVLQRRDNPLTKRQPHCEILAIGMNSDGRTPGVALPSSSQQRKLLEAVYQDAAIDPASVAFIEAHGTGTIVGDPAEAQALGQALGMQRSHPLPIGSAKSNVGHLEPASGLVGLLKAQLALEHGVYPATLHVEKLNPYIDFSGLNLKVATEPVHLDRDADAIAGVNNFGFGGTNVHVVLRKSRQPAEDRETLSAPAPASVERKTTTQQAVLLLSAQCKGALSNLAERYGKLIAETCDEFHIRDIANAAGHRRSRMRERLVVLGNTNKDIADGLQTYLQSGYQPDVVTGTAVARSAKTALVFSGNGAQWPGMGQSAFKHSPEFQSAFREVDRCYTALVGQSLEQFLFDPGLAEMLRRTEIAQPLLFGIQIALARALIARGLRPAAVIGHSVGEVAAAHICGALDLEQAVAVIRARSLRQEMVQGFGGMAAVNVSVSEATKLIDEMGLAISIAAKNSPRSVTISGDSGDLSRFLDAARQRHWAARPLDIQYPFHSAHLDSIKQPLLADLEELAPAPSQLEFYSTVTGAAIEGQSLTANYWWRNVREPVKFQRAVKSAADAGHLIFIEISPRTVLRNYLVDTLATSDLDTRTIATLDANDSDDRDPVGVAFARSLVAGAEFNADQAFGAPSCDEVRLPHYPWQNTEYRLEPSPEALNTITELEAPHPLLGMQLRTEDYLWESQLDTAVVPFLADHKVSGRPIMPGSGFIEIALSAARTMLKSERIELRDLDFIQALELDDARSKEVRTRIDTESSTIVISSRERLTSDERRVNVKTRCARIPITYTPALIAPSAELDSDAPSDASVYRLAARFSLNYGPAFQRLTNCREIGPSIIEVELSDRAADEAGLQNAILLHPTDLDASFHGLNSVFNRLEFGENRLPYVPIHVGVLRLYQSCRAVRTARIHLKSCNTRAAHADFELFASDGALIATLEDVRFKAASLVQKLQVSQVAYHIDYVAIPDIHPPSQPLSTGVNTGFAEAFPLLSGEDEGTVRNIDEINETHLLLDVGARRVAFDVLSELAGSDRQIPLANFPAHIDALTRLASPLVDTGLATLDRDVIALMDVSTLPQLDEIVHSILDHDPAWVADCTLLFRAAEMLPRLLSSDIDESGSSPSLYTTELLEHFFCHSPSAQIEFDEVIGALQRVVSGWPDERPLRILQLGAVGSRLTRSLLNLLNRPCTTLVVADTSERRLTRVASLGQLTPGFDTVLLNPNGKRIKDFGPFDILISINGLHIIETIEDELKQCSSALAPDATAIIAEGLPSAFRDVVFSAEQAGRPRPQAAWQNALLQAGLTISSQTKTSDFGASLFVARPAAMPDIAEGADVPAAHILVVADQEDRTSPQSRELVRGLIESHHDAMVVECGGADYSAILDHVSSKADQISNIVLMCGSDDGPRDDDLKRLEFQIIRLTRLLDAIKDLSVRIWIVAEGGARAVANAGPAYPVQTGIWSFARTATNEFHNIDIRLIDIAAGMAGSEAAKRLASMISTPGEHREIILAKTGTYALEVRRGASSPIYAPASPAVQHENILTRLHLKQLGSLDGLQWVNEERRTLAPGEIEVAVAATGLNYRDVMWALGLLPEEALEGGMGGPTIGFECSGTVIRIGPDVEDFSIGDNVIAMAPACFASHVIVASKATIHVPSGLSLPEAATIPVSFLTAHYALRHLAAIEPNEWVLIHGAAGGVGLAAVQVAKQAGAKIIATAGNEEKRALLKHFGADHVLDTRSLSFTDQVRQICKDGVDVILNSLAGEAMERSLELLRPFGRFLELGKRDFYGNTKVGLRSFRHNISYFGIDADHLLTRKPALASKLLRDISLNFCDGAYRPLPHRLFESNDIEEAFRLMQKSGHVGKILVRPPAPGTGASPNIREFKASSDGVHVVFGGTSGFGLEMVRWLSERGAKHILVASRSGGNTETLSALQTDLGTRGIKLTVERCDVSDFDDVAALLTGLRANQRLAGISLTAMVLDDGLISDLTPERIAAVLAPKVQGARNLDRLTENDDLDYLLLFSSAAAVFGNPGQASYVAANGYLDGLAHARRQSGKKALSIAWGAITDVGILARQQSVAQNLARHTGGLEFTARHALDLLATVLVRDDIDDISHVALAAMNWSMATQTLPIMATPSFAMIRRELALLGNDGSGGVDVRAAIAGLDDAAAKRVIAKHLAGEIAKIFRMPAEDISLNRTLTDLGMDSLMTVELYGAAERDLNIQLPLAPLTNSTTIYDIADAVLQKLRQEHTTLAASPNTDALAKHVTEEIDPAALAAVAARVAEHEQALTNVL